ncbi:MAG: hypothetical protein AAF383_01920 [Cyanobacteria bacterium P01_A01_bin.83]
MSLKLLISALIILTNSSSITAQAENDNSPETPRQSTSIMQALMSLFKSSEKRFISRGERACLISPGNSGEQLVWSDRPLFIWRGEMMTPAEINLYTAGNEANEQPVWTETIPPSTNTITYTGQLQPGATYDWELVSDDNTYRKTMQLMEQPQREAIAAELTSITNNLQDSNANAEDIAIVKADYFISQKLGSDALQELYSVDNPSADLAEQISNIEQQLCE